MAAFSTQFPHGQVSSGPTSTLMRSGRQQSHVNNRTYSTVVPFNQGSNLMPLKQFNIDSCPPTLVSETLTGSEQSDDPYVISVAESIRKITSQNVFIFILAADKETVTPLGTGTLVDADKILTARHILNGVRPQDIKIGFNYRDELNEKQVIQGGVTVLEDGATCNLDYAVLQLSVKISRIAPAILSKNNDVLGSSLLIHHPEGRPQHYSVHQSDTSAHFQLEYTSFHATDHISSGAGYRDVDNKLFAIHVSVNAVDSYARRAGLFINTILSSNPQTVLRSLINPGARGSLDLGDGSQKPLHWSPLPCFSLSFNSIDEGRREEAMGATPQIKSPVGREVLQRWEGKGKAVYRGFRQGNSRFEDYDNWKIAVRKAPKSAQRDWVDLNEKKLCRNGTYMAAIHMGHKLSAAQYWEQGALSFINKKLKYTNRYGAYKDPGHTKGFKSPIVRAFMKDPANYAFQWGSLNQHYGSGGSAFTTPPPGKSWRS